MPNVDECLQVLKKTIGQRNQFTPLHEPTFIGNEWQYVKECLDTGWVSSVGKYVDLFEEKLIQTTQSPFAIVAVNGTCALHICLLLANVKTNDEVLVPSLTFVATVNAIEYCKALPHFVDSCESNLGIDIAKLRAYLVTHTKIHNNTCINLKTNRAIKAIIPVHIFGHPVDMDELNQLAAEFCLTVIEDAAESLGSYYKGSHTGNKGHLATLSFNGNKVITTGGGGAILTSDPILAQKAKHLTTTAKHAHAWRFYHDEVGYNYRLPNLNAALGCAQLEKLSFFVDKKRQLAEKYIQNFEQIPGVHILKEPSYAKSNYWLNALVLEKANPAFIEAFIEKANLAKYGLRSLWEPIHRLPMYKDCPSMDLSQTMDLFHRVIALPSTPGLNDA